MNVTFVYDDIIVTTTIDSDDPDDAVREASDVLADNGLEASRAFEVQIDGEVYS